MKAQVSSFSWGLFQMTAIGNGTERLPRTTGSIHYVDVWDNSKSPHLLHMELASFILVPSDWTRNLLFTRRPTSGCPWNHPVIVKMPTLAVMSQFG